MNRLRLRRFLLILGPLFAVWAAIVWLTGGFLLEFGSLRVLSSRNPDNPAFLALICAIAAWALTPRAERLRHLSRGARIWSVYFEPNPAGHLLSRLQPQLAPILAGCAAIAVVIVGLLKGAPYAGGSDVYGYVSEAHLWATGTLRVEQPFVRDFDWPFAADAFTPLGYRHTADGTALIPIYPPGFPMVMAVFERLGGRESVFYVVPLLGGLAVWATYLFGRRFGGRTVGVSAAILLATSPTFLFQLMFPMSDVPVTAWWALSLALLLADGRISALASGLAAGAAILTRPNLVPLAVFPGALLLWRAVRSREATGPAMQRVVLFAAGVIPACVVVAIVNTQLWGSPLSTGYDPVDIQFRWKYVAPNLQRYPRWLLTTQTPAVLLALFAPLLMFRPESRSPLGSRLRAVLLMLGCFIACVCVIYFLHQPNDTWFWLRYLLPTFPALFVLISAVLAMALSPLERGTRLVATGVVLTLLAWHGVSFGVNDGIFLFKEGERRSRVLGEYVANNMPERAVFVAKSHTGSIRYYSGRLTMQYELIPPGALDSVVADLRKMGYQPYIVLEEWEEPAFLQRFAQRNSFATLDWPPKVLLEHGIRVRIYDPADKDTPPSARANVTEVLR